MMRAFTILAVVVSAVGFLLSMSHPVAFASMKGALIRATDQTLNAKPARAVEIARSDSGEFSLRAKNQWIQHADGDRYRRHFGCPDL